MQAADNQEVSQDLQDMKSLLSGLIENDMNEVA